jgi:hypothetical protein
MTWYLWAPPACREVKCKTSRCARQTEAVFALLQAGLMPFSEAGATRSTDSVVRLGSMRWAKMVRSSADGTERTVAARTPRSVIRVLSRFEQYCKFRLMLGGKFVLLSPLPGCRRRGVAVQVELRRHQHRSHHCDRCVLWCAAQCILVALAVFLLSLNQGCC